MLTGEAFNGLIKTLEEPPAHVIFILATTDASKLPDTIISRTQRYSFKPADTKTLVNHLRSIAEKEKIKIDNDAIALIAEHGDGSFRDSISLLDQLSHQDSSITLENVRLALGLVPSDAISQIVEMLIHQDVNSLFLLLDQLYTQGYQ